MSANRGVCLTGATGLLGRYLLRDLLATGRPVAVLVRDGQLARAAERVAEVLAFASESLRRDLPSPVVLSGDLCSPQLGLSLADRRWLGRHCRSLIHAAADLSFRSNADGEPWRTNVAGTACLLRLCQQLGLSEWHQVSTAFVCGKRRGAMREEDLDDRDGFHNPYEQSKFESERLLRRARGLRLTVYRPAVIVGDSRTGYTSSYAGFYRFLELASRLAGASDQGRTTSPAGRRLPLRLPLSGAELCNLVPVDWVSRAITELVSRPRLHGRTFHLVSPAPAPARLIQEVAAQELKVEGVEFAGSAPLQDPSRLEELFYQGLQEYWPYLAGGPEFLCPNATAALPHLLPPPVDCAALQRIIRFAVADRWGRHGRPLVEAAREPLPSCARYVEQVFPRQARRSHLAREAGLDLRVSLDVRGPGGGQWSCTWRHGELTCVERGLAEQAEVIYRTDAPTFEAVVHGRLTPQQAFFEQRIEIAGNLETALKLAVLFDQFLRENPYPFARRTEAVGAVPSPS